MHLRRRFLDCVVVWKPMMPRSPWWRCAGLATSWARPATRDAGPVTQPGADAQHPAGAGGGACFLAPAAVLLHKIYAGHAGIAPRHVGGRKPGRHRRTAPVQGPIAVAALSGISEIVR